MAIYVGLRKTEEEAQFASYEFGPNEDRTGLIRIDKESGEITVIHEVPGDLRSAYSTCAARKLVLHWRDGQFPDKTCFAS